MSKVTESVYSYDNLVIPMADVQHIEKLSNGIFIITKHTHWNFKHDMWDNPIFIPKENEQKFLSSWCNFRAEADEVNYDPKEG